MPIADDILRKKSPDRMGTLGDAGMTMCVGLHQQMEQILSDPILADIPERNALALIFGEPRDRNMLLGVIPINPEGRQTEPVSQRAVLKRVAEIQGFMDDIRTEIDVKTNALFTQALTEAEAARGVMPSAEKLRSIQNDYETLATHRGCIAINKNNLREFAAHVETLNPTVFTPQPLQMELL